MSSLPKGPFRDRFVSNSSDPVKSAIMKESAMGWTTRSEEQSDESNALVSPLRIAKRESAARVQQIALQRRSSSSYKHVRNNNLVSNSPFRFQGQPPAGPSTRPVAFPTRRVSGEKRPRPLSLHEEGENDNQRPFALKRERRQSRSFQGLIAKEPVSKSPFLLRAGSQEPEGDLLPPPPTMTLMTTLPVPAQESRQDPTRPSPTRSNLVSRRLHGPRLSGGRRPRRKTVTFDERCDVVEFDREEDESDEVFESASEEVYEDDDGEGDPFFQGQNGYGDEGEEQPEDSYDSTELAGIPPPEIPGESSEENLIHDGTVPDSTRESTPPRHDNFPTDMEVVDGIPLGRTHHAERLAQYRELNRSSRIASPAQPFERERQPNYPFGLNLPSRASPLVIANSSTPTHRSPGATYSTPPLGGAPDLDHEEEGDGDDVNMLPASPSPSKRPSITLPEHPEDFIPRFDPGVSSTPREPEPDPFLKYHPGDASLSRSEQEDQAEMTQDLSIDDLNPSIDHSEVTFDPLDPSSEGDHLDMSYSQPTLHNEPGGIIQIADGLIRRDSERGEIVTPQRAEFDLPPLPQSDASERARLAASFGSFNGSAGARTPSPSLAFSGGVHSSGSMSGRPRIDRDDVRRRLMARQNSPSLSPHLNPQPDREKVLPTLLPDDPQIMDEDILSDSHTAQKESDETSTLTSTTDTSADVVSMISTEEIANNSRLSESEFGLLAPPPRLQFDFGGTFSFGGLGFGNIGGSAGSRESFVTAPPDSNRNSAMVAHTDRLNSSGTSSRDHRPNSMKLGDVDVSVDMRSALDRLMDDVAGARAEDSVEGSDIEDETLDVTMEVEPEPVQEQEATPQSQQRSRRQEAAAIEPALMQAPVTESSSSSSLPPPLPAKGAIRSREALILEKRREARRLEALEDGYHTPPEMGLAPTEGRPTRKRSQSVGHAYDDGSRRRRQQLLHEVASGKGVGGVVVEDDPLGDSIERELRKLDGNKTKYLVKEREALIYASASSDNVSHIAGPGDVRTGKAWRPVRRPSDMNEYAKEIKEYQAQAKPGKAYGKVFVKVLGVKGLNLPLPSQSTAMTCTVNNGIHFVTTPECQIARDCKIDQEFELIEHSKLEFTLTLKIRKDPHILGQFKALTPAPAPPQPPPTKPTKSGMRMFFASPKRPKEKNNTPPPPPQMVENFARYLKPDGTLARAFIAFKDIAHRCDSRLFETSFSLIGQRAELGNKYSTLQVGEIVLQIFRLPPLPGLSSEQLPQSLEECHRGLRHTNWHKVTYYEGTLTQNGGDCSTWRRRQYRVIGGSLIAFNHVTKKPIATIDLKQAIAVEDDDEARHGVPSSSSGNARFSDEYDGLVERSFRLVFPDEEEIVFFADTDDEKATWLEVFRALIGHIPPYPLWGEILCQYQEERAKRTKVTAGSATSSPIDPPPNQALYQAHGPPAHGR